MDSQKVVLITGASSGMGEQTALLLAKKGFIVYSGTRNTKNINTNNLQNLIPLKLDITNPSNIKEAINTIIKNHKKIDILINNAGYGLVSTVEDLDEKEMFDQYNINVFGLLRVCKETIPFMRVQNSGIIINISSFLGKIGLPLLTLYNSSKYAVEGITDSLRYELSDFNIRVHSIMPGFFNTDFAKKNLVTNFDTFDKNSPYANTVSKLAPVIVEQINQGNDPKEVAFIIKEIIENENFPARATIGEKAKKFLPMKKELSDEDFERRVREYYNLG
ncbi:SDR family oxidoreductase [Poseidonibacter lekithochrous]|uniref:SDR family oxidoreductase n=1 Tax=Poseidonibacter lekithochrous TaxID=1904463 RepID=UPI0008FC36AB|nr:SDR family oxidoreductase [Poseidonibacter lekithochrous]QKJ22788.1 short-chain dehydrogenase/reductase [Poseidonibacter lekithochrous]